MSSDYTKTELKFRMISYILLGILTGIIMSQLWTGFIYIPNMRPYVPDNGNGNGNGNTTTTPITTTPITTTPLTATFIIVRFESDNALFHVGYDSYNGDGAIRFVLNVAEIAGFAGTLTLRFQVFTDHNIWGTRVDVGGDSSIYLSAFQIINDLEVHFVIEPEMYDLQAVDFNTAEVIIL